MNIIKNKTAKNGAARRTHTYMLCCSSERRGAKKTLMLFWITMIWAGGKSTCENKSHIISKPTFFPHWSGRAASRRAKINQIYFRNLHFFRGFVASKAQNLVRLRSCFYVLWGLLGHNVLCCCVCSVTVTVTVTVKLCGGNRRWFSAWWSYLLLSRG